MRRRTRSKRRKANVSLSTCDNCGKAFTRISQHLNYSKECQAFYNSNVGCRSSDSKKANAGTHRESSTTSTYISSIQGSLATVHHDESNGKLGCSKSSVEKDDISTINGTNNFHSHDMKKKLLYQHLIVVHVLLLQTKII